MAVGPIIDKGGTKQLVARYIPSYANPSGKTYQQVAKTNAVVQAKSTAANKAPAPKPAPKPAPRATQTSTTTPVTSPVAEPIAPVVTEPVVGNNAEDVAESATPAAQAWDPYNDPVYLQQLQQAQAAFNTASTNALADKERSKLATEEELAGRKTTAEEQRRRLAGNFAARGMAGGRAGALSRAEATANARELAARTSLRDQMAELDRQYIANFGAAGSDWLGTSSGASAQQAALQAAINARLAGLTTVG